MSALGGIYNFDGALIKEETLTALGNTLAVRGPDGGGEVCSISVGIVYRAFHTNRESRRETQPLVSHDRNILAYDGRLDNRDELLALLRDDLCGVETDVAIVMAAYLKWGVGSLPRMVGDFALSLWDPGSRRLVLARDPIGTRTLFYHHNKDRIIWSTELSTLLSLAGIKLEVEDEYVAGYLADQPEPGLTPYKGILSVPPGNAVVVQNGQLQLRRFWSPNPNSEIRYRSDSEYEEHFRQLFREAVRCRLRADGIVWSELSGGLDSSSIVCMADQILTAGETQAVKLETVSYVFDESPTSDERAFIRCVEEKRGILGHHLREDDYWMLSPFPDGTFADVPGPILCFAERHRKLCEGMREDDARVLLSGQGGDHLLWSGIDASPELADLLTRLELFALHYRIRAWSRAQNRPYLELLWKGAVKPILPRNVRARFQSDLKVPDWIDRRFAARMSLRERALGAPDTFGFRLPSSREQSESLLYIIGFVSAGYCQNLGCIDISYPYLHRPLIEFLMAIPFEQKLRPGETRSLHRRAFQNLLPERILRRKGKRGTDEVFFRSLYREWPRLNAMLTEARISARGYVDIQALRKSLGRARLGLKAPTVPLLKILSLEFWLRSLELRSSMFRSTAWSAEPANWPPAVQAAAANTACQTRVRQGTN